MKATVRTSGMELTKKLGDVSFDKVQFWIEVSNISIKSMSFDVAKAIGDLLEVDILWNRVEWDKGREQRAIPFLGLLEGKIQIVIIIY